MDNTTNGINASDNTTNGINVSVINQQRLINLCQKNIQHSIKYLSIFPHEFR